MKPNVTAFAFLFATFLSPSLLTAGIPVTLSEAQLHEFDETGWVTLSEEQKTTLVASKGFSPTRIRPVYIEPDGATSESGYNLALRTGDNSVEVYPEFLISDEEVKARIAYWKEMGTGPKARNNLEYYTYLVDADGRIWKYIAREDVVSELRKKRKKLGQVFLHTPTSLIDEDSIASRDTLRALKRVLEELELGSYEVTKKSR